MMQNEMQDVYIPHEEQEVDFRHYLMVFMARKWAVILVMLVVFLSSIAYVRYTEPVYQAKVTLVYEKTNPTSVAVLSKVSPLAAPELDINVQRVLLTSPIIMGEIRNGLSSVEDGMSELTDKDIKELLDLSSLQSSSVLELTAKGRTHLEASLLANTAAEAFIEMGTENKRAELDRAITFLDSQLKKFDQLLEGTEQELARFRELEGIIPSVSKEGRVVGGLLQKLGQMQEEAIHTEIEVGYTKAQLDSVRGLIANKRQNLTPDAQGTTFTPQIETLRNRLIQIETDLFAKQQALTDEHPEVVDLKEQVAVVQTQLQGELEKLLQAAERSLDPISEWQALLSKEIQFEVEFRGLEQKKKLQEARIAQFRRDHPELASQDLQLLKLERKRRLYEQSYLQMEGRYTEMSLLKQMRISDMRIIREAKEKDVKVVKPKSRQTLLLGVVLGLMLGVAAAVFLEYADNTVKSEQDVQRLTGRPVIGVVPKFGKFGNGSTARGKAKEIALELDGESGESGRKMRRPHKRRLLELLSRTLIHLPAKSPVAEAYRAIRGNLTFNSGANGSARAIVLTSPFQREGKSLTAANLAICLARGGTKTVLLDGDLHKPRQHRIFGVYRSGGFSDFLAVETENPEEITAQVAEGLVKATRIENLSVVSSGKSRFNSGDLLASQRVGTLIDHLKKSFEVVLIDSPPLAAVTDAYMLASNADASILIVKAGSTRRPLVKQMQELLARAGAVLGIIINGLDRRNSRYGYYYYGRYPDYYSADEEE